MRWPRWLRPDLPDIAICSQSKTGSTALFFKIKQALSPAYTCLFEPTPTVLTAAVERSRPLLVKNLSHPL